MGTLGQHWTGIPVVESGEVCAAPASRGSPLPVQPCPVGPRQPSPTSALHSAALTKPVICTSYYLKLLYAIDLLPFPPANHLLFQMLQY